MKSIKNPEKKTYFICREDEKFEVISYGVVEPNQTMNTGQPILDKYLDESEWLLVLESAGINPYPENEDDN